MCDDHVCYYEVTCRNGHKLFPFKAKKDGRIWWKSNECKSFYAHAYIEKIGPYDEMEKTVKCVQ